jgi:hypothetical protein
MPDSINNWNMASTLMVPKWMKVFNPVEEEDSIWVRRPKPQNVNTIPDRTKVGIRGVCQTFKWHENILVQSSRKGILPMFFYLDEPEFAKLTTVQEKMFQDTIQEYLTSIGIKWEDNQLGTPFDSNNYWHYFDISSEDMRTWYKYWNREYLFNERQGV